MRSLPIQAKGMVKAGIDGLDPLAETGQPASPGTGPRSPTVAFGRTDHLRAIRLLPVGVPPCSLKALIGDIRDVGGGSDTGQLRMGLRTYRKKGLCQGWVLGAGRGKTEPGNHPDRADRQQQMQALVPTQAVAPADVGLIGNHPCPRRLASRVGAAVPSKAS